jgi:hypothetical protein
MEKGILAIGSTLELDRSRSRETSEGRRLFYPFRTAWNSYELGYLKMCAGLAKLLLEARFVVDGPL